MADVRVVYRKFDGALHWHLTMQYLGEDEHGVWGGMPAGRTLRRGDEPPIVVDHTHVALLPRGGWWTAVFYAAPYDTEIYCDITTAPEWPASDEVTMVDLDLDVIRRRDGSVLVLDEDEFAEHRVRYGYPQSVIEEAVAATQWLSKVLGDGSEPFATRYRYWLDQVR